MRFSFDESFVKFSEAISFNKIKASTLVVQGDIILICLIFYELVYGHFLNASFCSFYHV